MRSDGRDADEVRLLPWTGEEGKPCYLITDGTGRVSRHADTVEETLLAMAADLLGHAADLLADRRTTPEQLRFLLDRMREALAGVCRVAESRGGRAVTRSTRPTPGGR
ncbi:hypothetical protein G3I31_31145 [Streptomyces sp. SID9913]|uniref:hypothetical protein n=1 Tax=Streptomyces sp. SID9913 TaxID=2706117 RepID=UPI0013DA56F5|nr:hypothetical protein [Streptomyces sp. SID9913]